MERYLITPVDVGDVITVRNRRGELQEAFVVEIGLKGFFVSDSPDQAAYELYEAPGTYIPYKELGRSFFLDAKAWMKKEEWHGKEG